MYFIALKFYPLKAFDNYNFVIILHAKIDPRKLTP